MDTEQIRELAEKYASNKSRESQAVAAVLYSLLGSMLMGDEVLLGFSGHCANFSREIIAQVDYRRWVDSG